MLLAAELRDRGAFLEVRSPSEGGPTEIVMTFPLPASGPGEPRLP